jgi:regulator of sigma E protease
LDYHYAIGLTVVILKVAVGLGFVIFVHELGHFSIAKLCGVKCEKFYLGFDIAGLKFCKFQWGETEYGIGVFPLGGYVKMLGQEDNPAKLREEMERAKAGDEGRGTGESVASKKSQTASNPQSPIPNPSSPPPPAPNPPSLLFDPRSFLAKSVPQRMAIISAGVIMNVIFAFLMAVAAYWIGVEQPPCVVGEAFSGGPAWQADLHIGDEILEISGRKVSQFRDMTTAIALGDFAAGQNVTMLIRRPGVKKPFLVSVKPDGSRGVFFVEVAPGMTTRLVDNRTTWLIKQMRLVLIGSAADLAKPPFRNSDEIVRIDDVPVSNYGDINHELARKADRKIAVTVLRAEKDAEGKSTGVKKRVVIAVKPNPMRHLGIVMRPGPVKAVQAHSPAAVAGIEPGDMLDGPLFSGANDDPMKLPDRLLQRVEKNENAVVFTIRRKDVEMPIDARAELRQPIGYTAPGTLNGPLEVSPLGIACQVQNEVASVEKDGPGAKAGIQPGDVIVSAVLLPPDKETLRKLATTQSESDVLTFDDKNYNWPALMTSIQETLPGTKVKLTYSRKVNGKAVEKTATLMPVEAADWFNPDRGLIFQPIVIDCPAGSVRDAIVLGGRHTLEDMTLVFRSVKALGTNRVSMRNMMGPVKIVELALHAADSGNAVFLLFLAFLSANLAVVNFMPIPVLDGGHFVLLCYEGIVGKPANEHVQAVLAYIGLILILALMVWVFGLDFGLISRH